MTNEQTDLILLFVVVTVGILLFGGLTAYWFTSKRK